MKHFKRNIFLCSLFCIIILLSCFAVIYLPQRISFLTNQEISSAIQLLSEHNITISKETIPAYTARMPLPSVNNEITDQKAFAQRLLGESASSITKNVYTTSESKLTLNANQFTLTPGKLFNSDLSGLTADNAGKKVKSILEKLGFNLSGTTITTIPQESGPINVQVTRKYKGFPIFNDSFTVTIDSQSISSISGVWFYSFNSQAQTYMPKSAAGALTEFALNEAYAGTEIKEVELGYRLIMNDGYTKIAELEPVWCIVTTDNTEHFIQA